MPNALILSGNIYPIFTDFRTGIAYQLRAAAGDLTPEAFLGLWFPGPCPENTAEAVEAVNRFYRRRDEPPKAEDPGPRAFDFRQDAEAIYAAFWKEYGIDLGGAEMHWWQFMALLEGLYTYGFSDRVGFRVADLSGLDAKSRTGFLKKRSQFSLAEPGKTAQGHLNALDEIIKRHGGDSHG